MQWNLTIILKVAHGTGQYRQYRGDHNTGTKILFFFTIGNYFGLSKGDPNSEMTLRVT